MMLLFLILTVFSLKSLKTPGNYSVNDLPDNSKIMNVIDATAPTKVSGKKKKKKSTIGNARHFINSVEKLNAGGDKQISRFIITL